MLKIWFTIIESLQYKLKSLNQIFTKEKNLNHKFRKIDANLFSGIFKKEGKMLRITHQSIPPHNFIIQEQGIMIQ